MDADVFGPACLDLLPFGLFSRILAFGERSSFLALAACNRHCGFLCIVAWQRCNRRLDCLHGVADGVEATPAYRFLRPRPVLRCVAMASYPRSGNTLLRRLLEEETGVVTGSDSRPNRPLSQSLVECGMQGEGIVDCRVGIVKTHWPERRGWQSFNVDRVVVLVRNPFDAIDSYFHMALTNTHDKSLRDDAYTQYADVWDGLVRSEIDTWCRFYTFWLEADISGVIVRYEDILHRPLETVGEVLDKIWPDAPRINRGHKKKKQGRGAAPYVPRRGKVGASHSRFSRELMDFCEARAGELLHAFGYADGSKPWQQPAHSKLGSREGSFVRVNSGKELREKGNPYGRGMTEVRRKYTDNDRKPLPLG
jgi:hypothetical protein